MKIIKVTRDDSFVRIVYSTDSGTNPELYDVTSHQAPVPEFDKAFDKLGSIASNISELSTDSGVAVKNFAIERTKYGTKSCKIAFTKELDATSSAHAMSTPQFRIDPPADGEQGSRECSPTQAKQIYAIIDLAEKYVNGERSQMILPLADPDAPEEAEPETGADLFKEESPKKRGRPAKPKEEEAASE